MHFVHRPLSDDATIAAVATAPGDGGVAIIRLSGAQSIAVAARLFSGPVHLYRSHVMHYGVLRDLQGQRLDEVLLVVFRAPRSYTGEDTVEIHCHGGMLLTRRILEAVFAAGARPAQPGEFSYRAFRHGKIDLAQAEAVQQLIGAKNEMALQAADGLLQGRLSQAVGALQHTLSHIAAILEAWVDFPEEGLEFASNEEVCAQLDDTAAKMAALCATFHNGRLLSEGLRAAIVGVPNVGKSSLLNALLDRDRAIVSDIPGTTRDLLEEELRLGGLHLRLIDTAGIRVAADAIEQEGIRRSQQAVAAADLVLMVCDAARGLTTAEAELLAALPAAKTIAVWNKVDLLDGGAAAALPALPAAATVRLSARAAAGLEQLQQAIEALVWQGGTAPQGGELLITKLRHRDALADAEAACRAVSAGLRSGVSAEFVAMDMRACLSALGSIIGTDITEDILSAIFATFCVGK